VVKFTSWFKDKTTKLHDADTSMETPESSEENIPQKKNIVRKVSSAILTKLPGSPKPLYRRYWFWAGVGLTGGFAALASTIATIDKGLPSASELNSVAREQTLTIKASDGTILQQSGPATRTQLGVDEIPEQLKQAFIASEDRRFLQHDGVDAQGIVRAVVNNLRSQNVVEGGSTITQQLARILFLKQEKTLLRKVREVRLAQKMERELSKDKILERYLNLVYLGSGAYGVADAAETYFNKPAKELTLAQMATIAGLAPAPSIYAPDRNPEAAKQRRNLVLQRMLEDKVITAEQKQEAINEPLTVTSSQSKRTLVAPYFTSFIQQELPNYISPEVIEAGGLTVETTINPAWQQLAEDAVAKTLKNQGRWENFKQAALVSVDPRSGEIKAMVGGKDFDKNKFNRATQAKRQPGSTFKGFVYATGIATGMSPYQEFADSPLVVDGYEPKNFDKGYRGSLDMRTAITKSVNIVAVRILLKVGFDPIIQLAHKMGIKSELKPTYSLALGSSEVNLLEMTSAYGSFATQGIHNEVHGVTRILNRRGEEIWKANFTPERALDEDSAKIMTWMLRNVVENGTGGPAQLSDRAVAGKTGTTDEARDLWFIGYIPQVVTGVWLGNDDNNPTDGSSASAAYTWNQFMAKAVKDMPVEKFPERPKLEDRKASIKAEPIKGRRIVNREIPDKDKEDKNNGDGESTPRRRRNRQESTSDSSNTEQRSSRRRRRSSEETQETPRRRSRRSRSEESNSSGSESRSRRRVDSNPSNSSSESRSRRNSSGTSTDSGSSKSNSSGSSESSGSSWRDRLRPGSGQ
jgi:penicillin-binding protein 1A